MDAETPTAAGGRNKIGEGTYRNGFRKHACPKCGTVLMVPFTYKSRLCMSCYRKKLFGWSMGLSEIMHTTLAHFHVTFTLPGPVTGAQFEKRFACEELITAAAGMYWKELLKSAGNRAGNCSAGVLPHCTNAVTH